MQQRPDRSPLRSLGKGPERPGSHAAGARPCVLIAKLATNSCSSSGCSDSFQDDVPHIGYPEADLAQGSAAHPLVPRGGGERLTNNGQISLPEATHCTFYSWDSGPPCISSAPCTRRSTSTFRRSPYRSSSRSTCA